MIESYLIVLFSLGVALTVISSFAVVSRPEASFLLSMFAIMVFVVTAYYSNYIEVFNVASPVANTTDPNVVLGVPVITRDPGIQWLSALGMIFNAVLLWLSSSAYGGAK